MAPPNGITPKHPTDYLQVPTTSDDTQKTNNEEHHHHHKSEEIVPEDDAEVVVPPDGGWGWVVVFASFMCNLIVDGIIFSFGVFLEPIADTFSVNKAEVALVGSLMSGFYLISGPFASAVANRYGFRLVAVLGSLLGAAAFALSYFATSVVDLCLTYGVLGGNFVFV